MPRNDLSDVFHLFITEEEQQEVRARSQSKAAAAAPDPSLETDSRATPALCWCMPCSPERPLDLITAVDLATAMAEPGSSTAIIAPFDPSPYLMTPKEVDWPQQDPKVDFESAWLDRLEQRGHPARSLALLPPDSMTERLSGPLVDHVDGILLPMPCHGAGLARTLRWLRHLSKLPSHIRIGAVLIDSESEGSADPLFRKLEGAARRQFGISVEDFGTLVRGPSTFRSLLHGVSTLELAEDSTAAESLRTLSQRLVAAPRKGDAIEELPA